MRKWAAGRIPDLVDRVEIGERLGVRAATLSRWHRRSILPRPDQTLGSIEIWKWETIAEWAKDRSRFAKRHRPTPMPDLADLAGIARRLEIDQPIVDNWQRNRRLPAPDYRWAAGDVWLWETIEEWQQTQLAGRGLALPARNHPSLSNRSAPPSGPKLRIAAVPAPSAAPSAPVDHRDGGSPVRPVASPIAPAAAEVTPARPAGTDPIGDMERLGAYFTELAESLSASQP